MKVKLLKKIRKRYSIVYYPSRKVYEVKHPHDKEILSLHFGGCVYPNYNNAYQTLIAILRIFYHEHTRKHKQSKINYKVWYNKKGD